MFLPASLAAHVLPGLVVLASAVAQQPARLLRFPHMQGDKIVFVYAGDLWTASAAGGTARRLTSYDEGLELSPRISPDGRWVAFSGEYAGSRQIYVVPYEGGTPRQLTFYPDVGPLPPRGGYDHWVVDWTPDGSKILIRANRTPYGERIGRYFTVDPERGGIPEPLEIPEGGPASFSPDGKKLAYNIISREWRTWKRYRAGRAQDVWIYDLEGRSVRQVTDFEGTDNFPMWLGDTIYYTSDRGGTLNLHAYDLATGAHRQVTHETEWDVLFPARGDTGVIYECGGALHVMRAEDESVRKLEIRIADDGPWLRPQWKSGTVADWSPAPSAKRIAVEYRGELFSVPAEHGETRPLTRTPDRRERQPRWSPDGKTLAYLAEVGDHYELCVRDLGTGDERVLTRGSDAWILGLTWSPDSRTLAFTDKRNRLLCIDAAGGDAQLIDRGTRAPLRDVEWSPDSRWLCYTKDADNTYDAVWLAAADGGTPPRRVTDPWHDSSSPTFDPDGRYLYFVSARDFAFDGFDAEQRLYALLLQADAPHPLAPRSDEEPALASDDADDDASQDESDDEAATNNEATSTAAPLAIDFDGIEQRLVVLPGSPGRYRGTAGVDGGVLFVHDGALRRYDLDKRKSEVVLDAAVGFALTADRKTLVYRHGAALCVAPAKPKQKLGENAAPLDGVTVRVVPRREWRQMFHDAWRLMRDWFYDPDMHGVDWLAMRAKYEPLLEHVAHRADLDFVLGELIGELNCGHTYVQSGETPRVERVRTGLLGCEFERRGEHYVIASIYAGENWHERTRSPLTEPGVDARVGDFVLAIDGVPLHGDDSPYRLLENTVGKTVTLTLNDTPTETGARRVKVRPIASEQGLRYLAWVRHNRALVHELSDGRIGYVHVPNTAVEGHRELFTGFRAQARTAAAMIIDDRYNGGGWIPDRMAFALGQPVLNYWARRHQGLAPTPQFAFEGPMAMLINGYSSSGGDAFPFYFRATGRGPLIGKRTWGGLVGYSGTPPLVDGGGLAVPSFAFVNRQGEWDVEAVGVAPDIEVFDDPALIAAGREPVLEAAVRHLLEQLEEEPPPPQPPAPRGPRRDKAAAAAADRTAAVSPELPWPRFRGPNGTGIAHPGTLPAALDASTRRFRTALPSGHSSPVVGGGAVFLTAEDDDALCTYALDADDGTVRWRAVAPRPRRSKLDQRNHSASPSPAIDADTVAVFFQDFGLLAYDHAGTERWRMPLGPFENIYGMGASPILEDGVVYLACDQNRGSYLLAVDAQSGEVVFKTERPMARSGHCTPVLWNTGGADEVVVPGSFLLDAYDARSGERTWWVEGLAAEMKSVPALHDGVLYINGYTSPLNQPGNQIEIPDFEPVLAEHDGDGDGNISKTEMPRSRASGYYEFFDLDGDGLLDGTDWEYLQKSMASLNGLLAIRAGGAGDVTADNVIWTSRRAVPQLPSPLVYDGVLYVLQDQGGLLRTMRPDSGELLARGRLEHGIDNYYAAPVAGDGKVYFVGESGLTNILPAGGGLEPLWSGDLDERCYATPALAAGRVYVRTEQALHCFGTGE